ncbi:hypothetical protein CHUAL_001437 [Chamberlinius hualienensis]
MDNGSRLLVLFIAEGKHFPHRQFTNIVVEAKFDGEALRTDPISHISNPTFNVELAWEVDRRTLHELHIKRTPVKIQVYAVNTKTSATESIGYIILDSRQAHKEIETAKPKWHPLLNSKYRPQPEMLICLGLDIARPLNIKSPSPPAVDEPELNLQDAEKEELQPTLRPDGAYQIGPPALCTDTFLFSFTVGFAANLNNLMPPTTPQVTESSGYFFYYTLLGNDIVTDHFYDLNLEDFSPERASVRLRSNLSTLRLYFTSQGSLQVHLCSGQRSLGSAVVPINNFIKQNHKSLSSLSINMEDCYEIKTSRHSQLESLPEAMKPVVGISISLKAESNIPEVEQMKEEIETPIPKISEIKLQQSPPVKLTVDAKRDSTPHKPKPEVAKVTDTVTELSNRPKEKLQRVESGHSNAAISANKQKLNSYELTIDLHTIKNVGSSLLQCTVRYSWPYFGNIAPISTDPPVYIAPDTECNLPQGSTTVGFATISSQMKSIFSGNPISLEVIDHEMEKNLTGKGSILLSPLISKPPDSVVNDNGKKVQRWSHSQLVFVVDSQGLRKAEIEVNLTLDDLGPFESNDIVNEKESNKYGGFLKRSKEIDPDIAEKVALELEQWKEWQEAMFTAKLKEKEKQHMEALAEAWTQKEIERETLFKKRLEEYNDLEGKLKSAVDAVEKRERQLLASEAELQRMKTNLQCEYDRLVQEVKDVSRRVKEECAHRNELERNKAKSLQEECIKWQSQIAELEKKLEQREAEFQVFKEQKERPEIRLQSQINFLNLEKAELERKNDSLCRSKVHYKQQYGKCLKELARLKQAMQLEAQAQLREKKKELLQMKLDLEKQTNQQQDNNWNREKESATESNSVQMRSSENEEENRLANLLNVKEALLQTGLYRVEDAVIAQLNKEIRTVLDKLER